MPSESSRGGHDDHQVIYSCAARRQDETLTHLSTHDPDSQMTLVRAGIDTHHELVVFMRADCPICRSEGFDAQGRVWVEIGNRRIVATLLVVTGNDLLATGQAALSESAWRTLQPRPGELATFRHADSPQSAHSIRAKVYGHALGREQYAEIMRDAVSGTLSDLELASFLTACSSHAMGDDEITALTLAMTDAGQRLEWHNGPILDKHCVGGLAGNRTTPIVVAIVAACGGTIPKTSSRAITSPAGTADTMETLAPVELSLAVMRRVVEREGGCVVWGGSVGLSPADDVLIRVARVLDFDSTAQLVASVLSKKLSAGSTHVLLDLPVGPTAKVRSTPAAESLGRSLVAVADAVGLKVRLHVSDGTQPVGRGIGPALEARDLLAVLECRNDAPLDLRDRALDLAGAVLELGGTPTGEGRERARRALDNGDALRKFEAICEAQGGRRVPPIAAFQQTFVAEREGIVRALDNRVLSKLAKLAGAPGSAAAGIELHVRAGDRVSRGQPLMTLHATTPGELEYAMSYLRHHGSGIETGAA